jgi:hypothetical protein
MSVRNFSATPTQLIVEDSLRARFYQLDAQELILEERPSLQTQELYQSLRISMLVTLKLFVSSVKMQLELLSNMTTGRLSKPEIVEQLWQEPINQLHMVML